MHRTLKREATRPPKANLSAQQRHFNDFRRTFNQIRPHEALDDATQDVTQSVNHQLAPLCQPSGALFSDASGIGTHSW